MRAVGIRELKNRLSEYLRAVRSGEQVLVTDRGRVIAELRAPSPYPRPVDHGPGMAALVRDGAVRVGLANTADVYPDLPRRVPNGTAAGLLDELRGEP